MNVQNKQDKYLYVKSFFYPLIIFLISCFASGIFPFGEKCLATHDGYTQYSLLGYYFSDRILSGENLTYSMEIGFGGRLLPTFAYYMM